MGMWRNGRREGLKIPWQQYREGSTPSIPTTSLKYWRVRCAHSSTGQSVWLRTKRLGVQVLLGAPDEVRDVAQLGRVLDLGSRCHRFESCHPDHLLSYGAVWRGSLVGQSDRFIPGRSWVRVPPSLPLLDPQLSWSELPAHNRVVEGSSPSGSTNFLKTKKCRSTQVAEGSGLENRQVMQVAPGFESQLLRQSHREVEQSGSSSGS